MSIWKWTHMDSRKALLGHSDHAQGAFQWHNLWGGYSRDNRKAGSIDLCYSDPSVCMSKQKLEFIRLFDLFIQCWFCFRYVPSRRGCCAAAVHQILTFKIKRSVMPFFYPLLSSIYLIICGLPVRFSSLRPFFLDTELLALQNCLLWNTEWLFQICSIWYRVIQINISAKCSAKAALWKFCR